VWGISVDKLVLPDVLDGHETLSLTLREECTLRVFGNRVLKRTFGPKKEDVTGDWRELHNEELRNLYSLENIVRIMEWKKLKLWVM
jgi:hypothetical protein